MASPAPITHTFQYLIGTVTTGGFAAASWFIKLSETVKVGAGVMAIICGVITIYKFIEEKTKKP